MNVFFKKMIYLRSLGVKILLNAAKVIFLSSTYKEKTIENYIPLAHRNTVLNKSVIIANGIDSYWLEKRYEKTEKANKSLIKIIFAGRISKRKNIITTIKACNILLSKGYTVKFTIVGRIEDKSEFKKIMRYDFIEYIQAQPKEELIKLYSANDIFVMPSITETFGLVYAEAMSQGLPVIYSKGQGFDGQFEEGLIGFHVDCFSEEEIASRILDILINYDNISNNCTYLSKKFNWHGIADEYIKAYYGLKIKLIRSTHI